MKKIAAIFLIFCIYSCKTTYKTNILFDDAQKPERPDYSKNVNWAALPWKKDFADLVPDSSLQDLQEQCSIDVFYIHPTTFTEKSSADWNASTNDSIINYLTDYWPIRHQASIFNNIGKIYAPRYRQAHIKSYFHLEQEGSKAILFAYEDVKSAFEYYLKNYNKNRPFIIASHSQGTTHASFLIRDFIDNSNLKDQLIAAYLVGMSVNKSTFKNIKPCEHEVDIGCFLSWQTYAENILPNDSFNDYRDSAFVINPITWKTDETFSNLEDHQGILMPNFKKIYRNSVQAKINREKNILWIKKPKTSLLHIKKIKNYHIGDYNLFWFNIRENAKNRTEKYFEEYGP